MAMLLMRGEGETEAGQQTNGDTERCEGSPRWRNAGKGGRRGGSGQV